MMLLIETKVVRGQILESDRAKLPDGVLCRVKYPVCNIDEVNANDRIYEREVWDIVLKDSVIQEKLNTRTLFGQAEHPAETQSDLQLTSHVVTKMWIDESDNKLYQEFDILDTPTGRIVDTILRAGCQVGVSTRAEGDLEEVNDEKSGKKYSRVIPEAYRYTATDFTADPSTFGVTPQKIERNVVTSIKKQLANENLNENEKHFANLILESIACKTSKCVVENAKKLAKKVGEKRTTIEDIMKQELIKVGVLVEYKGKECKVEKIEENMVGIVSDGKHISINGAAYVIVEPDGKIFIQPQPDAPEVDVPPPDMGVEQIDEPVTITDPGNTGMGMPAVTGEEKPELKPGMPVETKDGIKGKILSVNEDVVDIEADDGTQISFAANQLTITLPSAKEEVEEPIEEPIEEPEEKVIDDVVPEEEEIPESKTTEAKMGVDYIKTMKAAVKVATTALKDKDYEAAAKALEDVADDASDASRAAKKMKRANDAKAETEKEKEVTEDKVDEELPERKVMGPEDTINVGDTIEIRNLEDTKTVILASKVIEVGTMIGDVDTEFHKVKTEEGGDKWYEAEGYTLVKIGEKVIDEENLNEPAGFQSCVDKGGRVRTMSGPDKKHGLKAGEYVKYCYIDGKSFRGEIHTIKSESKVSTIAKDIKDLRIKEASTRAEKEKAFEILESLSDIEDKFKILTSSKVLETKILIKKLKESQLIESDEVKALCQMLENKAEAASLLGEQLNSIKIRLEKDLNDLKESADKVEADYRIKIEQLQNENKNTKEEYEKKLVEEKARAKRILTRTVEKARKEVLNTVIKEFVDLKISDSGLKLHENVRALLEDCGSLIEVNETLEKVRDVKRWSALHSESLNEIAVMKPVDSKQDKVNKQVGAVFGGFGYKDNVNK